MCRCVGPPDAKPWLGSLPSRVNSSKNFPATTPFSPCRIGIIVARWRPRFKNALLKEKLHAMMPWIGANKLVDNEKN
jgi:hypothetical protein